VHTSLVPRNWLGTVYDPHWVVVCKTLHFPEFVPKVYSSHVGGIVIFPEIRRTRRVWLTSDSIFLSTPVWLVSWERNVLCKGSTKYGVILMGEKPAANLFPRSPPLICISGTLSWAIWKVKDLEEYAMGLQYYTQRATQYFPSLTSTTRQDLQGLPFTNCKW